MESTEGVKFKMGFVTDSLKCKDDNEAAQNNIHQPAVRKRDKT